MAFITQDFSVNKLTKKKKKKMLKIYKLLNISFHKCSYKKSCFTELVYKSSVLVLMVYSYKDILKDLALDLVGSFERLLYFVYSFG